MNDYAEQILVQEVDAELSTQYACAIDDSVDEDLTFIEEKEFEQFDKAKNKGLKLWTKEPPKLELKTLPKHLEYAFLGEGTQLPVIIDSNPY